MWVAVLVTTMWTPATTALLGSYTVPTIRPVASWAEVCPENASSANARHTSAEQANFLRFIKPPPRFHVAHVTRRQSTRAAKVAPSNWALKAFVSSQGLGISKHVQPYQSACNH